MQVAMRLMNVGVYNYRDAWAGQRGISKCQRAVIRPIVISSRPQAKLKWLSTRWLMYVNSLRTQERGANPSYVYENRKPFLDQLRAGASLVSERRRPVRAHAARRSRRRLGCRSACERSHFLTGDAGDGKTALCAQVARRLGRDEELIDVTPVGKWLIVKDASEVEEDRLQALLAERLTRGTDRPRLLVAINEGRLRRVMRFGVTTRPGLWEQVIEPALEAWIDDEAARRLDERMRVERVTVLNFRHRFHVPTVVPSLLAAVDATLLVGGFAHLWPLPRASALPNSRQRGLAASAGRHSRTSLTYWPARTSQANDYLSGDFKRCWQWR